MGPTIAPARTLGQNEPGAGGLPDPSERRAQPAAIRPAPSTAPQPADVAIREPMLRSRDNASVTLGRECVAA